MAVISVGISIASHIQILISYAGFLFLELIDILRTFFIRGSVRRTTIFMSLFVILMLFMMSEQI